MAQSDKLLRNDNMTKEQFLAEMELLDMVLAGRGQEIAKKARVSYNTYLNYRQGRGNDEKLMIKILDASKKVVRGIKHHLNSINL